MPKVGRQRLLAAFANGAVVAMMIAPLIIGSLWAYGASARAFLFQHEIREAQSARSRLIRTFVAAQGDVRGFAATKDRYFASEYRAHGSRVDSFVVDLLKAVRPLEIPGIRPLIVGEREAYRQWDRMLAAPIVNNGRANATHLLKVVDPILSARILADDTRTGALLDDVAAESEQRRQDLLSKMLVASVILVALATATVVVLLMRHASYAKERRISQMLQSALRPEVLPSFMGVRLNAKYVPATTERQVGGDWFEAVNLPQGRLLLIVGDVAGHGLEAAVVMNQARLAVLRAAVIDSNPARILQAANRALSTRTPRLVSVACCVFDGNTMTLTCGTAGHPPPVVAPTGTGAYILPNGAPPLGILNELEIESFQYRLEAGSLVVLYTDGLTEELRDVVSSERSLLAAAEQSRNSADPAAAIFATVLAGRPPRDDVAILTMRVEPPRHST